MTWPGETFAARVATSLVANVGLPELIAESTDDYERKAVRLARHQDELSEMRCRLAANRTTWPLFDTPRLVRNLERAYRGMCDRYEAGQAPGEIVVTETDAGVRPPSARVEPVRSGNRAQRVNAGRVVLHQCPVRIKYEDRLTGRPERQTRGAQPADERTRPERAVLLQRAVLLGYE